MSRRMIPQKDQDYIEVLSTALSADKVGNVEVGGDFEVGNNAIVGSDAIVSGAVTVSGDVEANGNVEVGNELQVDGKLLTGRPSQIQIGYDGPTLPDFPSDAGTYVLKLTVNASGNLTFAWIAA